MSVRDVYRKLERSSDCPEEFVEAFSADCQCNGYWPYAFIGDRISERWPQDVMRNALALNLVQKYDASIHWPVALYLLAPPYPDDQTSCLNLLSFGYAACAGECRYENGVGLFLRRAFSLLVFHALNGKPAAAFQALNVLGAVKPQTLILRDCEQASLQQLFKTALSTTSDDELVEAKMRERAEPATRGANADILLSASPDAISALVRPVVLRAAQEVGEWFKRELAHVEAGLRAFCESQSPVPGRIGSASVRVVEGKGSHGFAVSLGVVQMALEATADFLSRPLRAFPAELSLGSIEIVAGLDGNGVGCEPGGADDDAIELIAAGPLMQACLDLDGNQRIPESMGRLLEVVWSNHLTVRLELRAPDGRTSVVKFDREGAGVARKDAKRRRGMRRIASSDVPQADRLARVFRVVELIANGQPVDEEGLGGVVGRQTLYYMHAAKVLGLVGPLGAITPAGLQVASLEKPEDKLSRASFLFEVSRVGRAWLDWADAASVKELPADTAKQFILEATDVGGSTIGRRAMTLSQWVRSFQQLEFVNGSID